MVTEQKVIHRALVGSRLWNLHTTESDYDYRNVVITPLREKLYNSAGNRHVKTSNEDGTYYELDHFMRLLEKGNPTILETLLANPKSQLCEAGLDIFRVVDFDQMVASSKGLATSQLKQLAGHADPKRRGKAIASGLTGLFLINVVAQGSGWIPLPPGYRAQLLSMRNGDNLLLGKSLLEEAIKKDYSQYRWDNATTDVNYVKDFLLNSYLSDSW